MPQPRTDEVDVIVEEGKQDVHEENWTMQKEIELSMC